DRHRLLAPERAVVVERGDPLGGRDEVGPALRRHALDEVDDGRLRLPVVPARQLHRLRPNVIAPSRGPGIGDFLPSAVGVAISPLPIVAVVLMLVTPRGRVNGPMFVVGWWVGLAI